MNTSVVRLLGASALLVLGLSACSGPANTAEAGAASETSAATATPSPTPTEDEFKMLTADELAAITGAVKDSESVALSVMPAEKVSQALDQMMSLMTEVQVEPAECNSIATGTALKPDSNTTLAVGASTSSTAERTQTLSLLSGVEKEKLDQTLAQRGSEIDACRNISMDIGGMSMTAATTRLDSGAATPGAIAMQTDVTLPTGATQSTVMTFAVKGGVLISAQASGSGVTSSDLTSAEALLDQAAALID
ncbi:hypothetical protein JOE31_003175 [Arthrobacter sp. PvP023]|uniref:hypothetical protein n=1 Tax=Micrococcaceae TaxID=1268 RepID=UPI001AE26E24|nr:hypothetical protein [Arthrobacter sp. PvP023]MBP1136943.1 hypothetical protein [Arthrobacter sp. PvP023]